MDQQAKASDEFPFSRGEIDLNLLRFDKIVGKGSYGVAHQTTYLPTGEVYVVKVIPKTTKEIRRMALHEASVGMTIGSSPNICRTFAFYEDKENVYIIMENVEGMDLNRFIATNPGIFSKNPGLLLFVIGEILNGIKHLHDAKLVHSDIKPQNVLLGLGTNSENIVSVKIIDFGMCKKMTEESIYSADGTIGYQAPEIAKNIPITQKIDIWSLGILIYKMLTMNLPPCIASKNPDNALRRSETIIKLRSLLHDKVVNPFEIESTDANIAMIQEVVKLCLTVNPLFRPTSEKLSRIITEIALHFK